jgi:hypothetical protein
MIEFKSVIEPANVELLYEFEQCMNPWYTCSGGLNNLWVGECSHE